VVRGRNCQVSSQSCVQNREWRIEQVARRTGEAWRIGRDHSVYFLTGAAHWDDVACWASCAVHSADWPEKFQNSLQMPKTCKFLLISSRLGSSFVVHPSKFMVYIMFDVVNAKTKSQTLPCQNLHMKSAV